MKDQHVNPQESVQIFQDLGCQRAMAVHWGTFQLTDEALDEPPRELAKARQAASLAPQDFVVLAIGETMKIKPRLVPTA